MYQMGPDQTSSFLISSGIRLISVWHCFAARAVVADGLPAAPAYCAQAWALTVPGMHCSGGATAWRQRRCRYSFWAAGVS